MNNVRLQICTGLFRSASNLAAFENMLALLSRSARTVGPDNPPVVSNAPMPVQQVGDGVSAAPAEEEIKLPAVTIRRETPKVGRNDPCPCGSGKKFKNCHGA
jgi:preprotein translocase subunit SecA